MSPMTNASAVADRSIRSRGQESSVTQPTSCSSGATILLLGLVKNRGSKKDSVLGEDIWADLIDVEKIPEWPKNIEGSPNVSCLGHNKMKRPDWKRWFHDCFQTPLWIGVSTPAYSVQVKCKAQKAKARTKARARAKAKGKAGNLVRARANGEQLTTCLIQPQSRKQKKSIKALWISIDGILIF